MTIVVEVDAIQIERLDLGPFGTNTYIITCRKMRDSGLIDAPAEANMMIDKLKNLLKYPLKLSKARSLKLTLN